MAVATDSRGDIAASFYAIESELCAEHVCLCASIAAAQDRIAELECIVKPEATLIYDRSQAQGYSLETRLASAAVDGNMHRGCSLLGIVVNVASAGGRRAEPARGPLARLSGADTAEQQTLAIVEGIAEVRRSGEAQRCAGLLLNSLADIYASLGIAAIGAMSSDCCAGAVNSLAGVKMRSEKYEAAKLDMGPKVVLGQVRVMLRVLPCADGKTVEADLDMLPALDADLTDASRGAVAARRDLPLPRAQRAVRGLAGRAARSAHAHAAPRAPGRWTMSNSSDAWASGLRRRRSSCSR